jgi:hypothetical protein
VKLRGGRNRAQRSSGSDDKAKGDPETKQQKNGHDNRPHHTPLGKT